MTEDIKKGTETTAATTTDDIVKAMHQAGSRIATAENRLKLVNFWLRQKLSNEKWMKWARVRDEELAIIERCQQQITDCKNKLNSHGTTGVQEHH